MLRSLVGSEMCIRDSSGEFPVINKHLVVDLIKRGLWNDDVRNEIIANNGSVQKIACIDKDLKELYKIVWEVRMKDIIDMAASRGKYIDQSQSLNLFLESPKSASLTSMHFYAWKQGLKTGMYYLRSRPAVDAIKFTVDMKKIKDGVKADDAAAAALAKAGGPGIKMTEKENDAEEEDEGCIACGS
eukprot:TRINITY_DN12664_c0_g1_i16.p2 TRINITY_DN12664_c0_g1~~TRINITY_DN12664_c0_g1_i16.p2  ORF type:complete len:186 (+),score=87.19 TRINITY_DN12664_c0_g1_i16:128-685(+)